MLRLAVAQARPRVGHVECNIDKHLALADLASRNGAGLVIFPELSLTGYEPSQAQALARYTHDSYFEKLQCASDHHGISIGVGVPLRSDDLPRISTLIFRPHSETLIYSKVHLHPDELKYFAPGAGSPVLIHEQPAIALAICFELSVPEHARHANEAGAVAYIASVAKTASGVANASKRLSEIAAEFSIPVFMANCLGVLDGAECTGCSSVWNRDGELLAQLDEDNEGVIVVDIDPCAVVSQAHM